MSRMLAAVTVNEPRTGPPPDVERAGSCPVFQDGRRQVSEAATDGQHLVEPWAGQVAIFTVGYLGARFDPRWVRT